MRTHRKYLPFLYLFLASLLPFSFFIILVDPSSALKLGDASVGVPLFFFSILFLSSFALFTFIFASRRRGALASLFICGIFALRFFGLRSIFQIIVLLTIILLVEYLYTRRTPPQPKKIL